MSNFICPKCGVSIIENERGVFVKGCIHYPADDFIDLSGKQMSDGKSIEEADLLAFKLMMDERRIR